MGQDTPRLLINRELVGVADPFAPPYGGGGLLLEFGPENTRDAVLLGDCDDPSTAAGTGARPLKAASFITHTSHLAGRPVPNPELDVVS